MHMHVLAATVGMPKMAGGVNAGVAEFTLRYATSRVVLYMHPRVAAWTPGKQWRPSKS